MLYDSDADIAGFQFSIDADLVGASGGAAEEAGFQVSTGANGTVLGFSFSGASIPAGEGVLTVLEVEGSEAGCIENLVLSSVTANEIAAAEVIDCYTISYVQVCGAVPKSSGQTHNLMPTTSTI